ncbi:terpenoid synthase [Rhizoclosmatium globosum]|uniref:Bifunctional lycopene cyclase/phytoene synthase n=1 Tax=Rhizoclosmatium globosum TaxID=329046 RepID=A0A1Y2D0U6_9FUNG|nr:terpenoid synthase [Rhizoclosmatium globosum]|eukprot:ORY52898.1 terpenoid synthase [Rhizoclosmatium globosum]
MSSRTSSNLTYFGVHCIYTLPPILVLYTALRPFITATEIAKVVAICLLAVVYTTPWDNYIVAKGAWTYPKDRVLGVIGYVPVEEYAFFIIQTVFTGLVYTAIIPWNMLVFHLKPASGFVRYGPIVMLLSAATIGFALAIPGTKNFYIGALLAWSLPILALEWLSAGPFIWSLRTPAFAVVGVSTAYLCFVDHTAIKAGVWQISHKGTTGLLLTPHLPIEEALFFLIVNCMIVFGLLAIDRGFAVVRVQESRVGGREERIQAFSLDLYQNEETDNVHGLSDWTFKEEAELWIRSAFMAESLIDQLAVKDYVAVYNLICSHSKTFAMATILYPQSLREDIVALYGFCRVSDDVADAVESGNPFARHWKEACMTMLDEYVHLCYEPTTIETNRERMENLISGISAVLKQLPTPSNTESTKSVLRLFSNRIPRSVPKECILELLDSYKWDLAGKHIITEADLIEHSGHAASSVGEGCTYLMMRHDAECNFFHAVDCVNKPHKYVNPPRDLLEQARDMGLALQLTNIARDLIADAEELGRTYIPHAWFIETITRSNSVKGNDDLVDGLRKRKGDDSAGKILKSTVDVTVLRTNFIKNPTGNPAALKAYSQRLVEMASPKAESALIGISRLPKAHRSAVKAALKMYMRIGEAIVEAKEYPRRSVVSKKDKLLILLANLYN